jgi:hypothetical protein
MTMSSEALVACFYAVCLLMLLLQCASIDNLHVPEPLHLGPAEVVGGIQQWTLKYTGSCNDSVVEARLHERSVCPSGRRPGSSVEIDYSVFRAGCKGNVFWANSRAMPLEGLTVAFAFALLLLGLWVCSPCNKHTCNADDACLQWDTYLAGNTLIICGLSWILAERFATFSAIEQCNPVDPGGYLYDFLPSFGRLVQGCVWHLTTWADEQWVVNELLPRCPTAHLDNTDRNRPFVHVDAVPSDVVAAAIAVLVSNLRDFAVLITLCSVWPLLHLLRPAFALLSRVRVSFGYEAIPTQTTEVRSSSVDDRSNASGHILYHQASLA